MATPDAEPRCHRCAAPLAAVERVGRAATCAGCGVDVHVCRNCAFYAAGAHNDCREASAERVVDKERANFCEFFQLGSGASGSAVGDASRARAALGALFRKP